jgi:hypothetical protein
MLIKFPCQEPSGAFRQLNGVTDRGMLTYALRGPCPLLFGQLFCPALILKVEAALS